MIFRKKLLISLLIFSALLAGTAWAQDHTTDYHVEIDFKPNGDEIQIQGMIRKLCKEKNIEMPLWDQALSAAARELLKGIVDGGSVQGKALDNERTMSMIQSYGGSDVALRTNLASMTFISQAEGIMKDNGWIDNIGAGNMTHFGLAVESKLLPPQKFLILIFSRRPILLQPFPRQINQGQAPHLKGNVFEPVKNLRILLASPSGKMKTLRPTVTADGRIDYPMKFEDGGGKYTIELQVDGPRGPEIAALFAVNSMADISRETANAPYIVVPDLPPAETEAEAEGRVFSLVNSARQSAGLQQLTRDGQLDKVARIYARKMLTENFVGHEDPNGKDVTDRVKAARIPYQMVAENIAVSGTVIDAHKNLMSSPAHAAMVLNGKFTRLGVGVILSEEGQGRMVYVVEIFLLPPD